MVMVLVKTVMKARDFLFARKHARPNVMTLQIAANNPLICMLLYQIASSCSLELDSMSNITFWHNHVSGTAVSEVRM